MATEYAYAKVNLTLHVTGQRGDGYHLLDSLVVFCGIADVLHATPAPVAALVLQGPFAKDIPADCDNLVLKAARLVQPDLTAAFTLTKKTPTMRQGMAGRYCFELVANQAKATYRKVVDKNNPYSHLQDALQYVCHAIRNPTDYNFSWRNHNICDWDGKPLALDAGTSTPLNMAGFC